MHELDDLDALYGLVEPLCKLSDWVEGIVDDRHFLHTQYIMWLKSSLAGTIFYDKHIRA